MLGRARLELAGCRGTRKAHLNARGSVPCVQDAWPRRQYHPRAGTEPILGQAQREAHPRMSTPRTSEARRPRPKLISPEAAASAATSNPERSADTPATRAL